jgi:ATP-dependent DNA helicase RecQ
MQDQINQLTELGIEAVVLNSAISYEEYKANIYKIKTKKTKLLYVAPETLLKENIISLMNEVDISCITIDEAHCISEWGHDFRPEYRMLADVRSSLPKTVCIALTATATPRVQDDIRKSLDFEESNAFISSFNRENLFLKVEDKENPLAQTVNFIKQFPNQSGIIYCFSRQQVDNLASELKRKGFSVRPYHAGLSEEKRKRYQDLFIKDDVQIIVATIAFGMGINKPNVRFVLHYDLPKNIESYYQEIGRAGRDGLKSECLLLFSYGDINKIRYFINQKDEKEKIVANTQLNSLVSLVTSEDCRRLPMLSYFGEVYDMRSCEMCDNCLSPEKEKQDLTIPAQKFLSCVKRTRELYGMSHIIDVLRGSQSKKVLAGRHDKLSTYGIGKDYSKKDWVHIAQQLINAGLMKKEDIYGSLKLTKKSYELFKGKIEFYGVLKHKEDPVKSYKKADYDYDAELFELLRRKRKELADKSNVPPYIIFSDRALIEMASFFPQSYDSMLDINGVGQVKLKKYGKVFLEIISDYAKNKNKQEKIKIKPGRKKETKIRKYMIIGREYNEGKSIDEIIKEYNIKLDTILNNLFEYVQDGHKIRHDGLLEISLLTSKKREQAAEAFEKKGYEYLKPVFDELDGTVSYTELKIMRLYCMGVGFKQKEVLIQ